ncbi:helix-turn-helix transcriptional regulator [Saccharopolyspora sp. TS4A08]|uniref:Helix-turn-helix transcriptional regulator n=1 Tax=Saccharopolyspora ipomoeae TaxID=3042027 RepID=A0ABT6PJT4_9PSEU|nr:helix-turn-helix transcriptional regulator [Saccharopolyspora sp. TS4A08]MDI2028261.1 helix-turn-helix transcriptional regulator [Saccharopolyspora sp. TS4A08]
MFDVEEALTSLRTVIDGPLHEIAPRFSRALADGWPHTALVIFTRECTGRPRKVAGSSGVVDKITIEELDRIKADIDLGGRSSITATLGGSERRVWALRDRIGTLLVLVPRGSGRQVPHPELLAGLFGVVATSIRQQVAQASPDYLAESRAASSERARTIAELVATHETALVTILSALRSSGLDDHRARIAATEAAASALVATRSVPQSDAALSEEGAQSAFGELRKEIRQTLRHHEAEVEFVAPTKESRALPGEIAYAARAMTRTVVLAFTAQPELTRLRIAWYCAEDSLRVDVRDDHSGALDVTALRRQLDGRARTLGGSIELEATPGWGSRAVIDLPLETVPDHAGETRLASLNRRELDVLTLVARGKRNKTIAAELGVTESTIKFHMGGVLKKLEVTTRGEAAALAMAAGIS